MQQSSRPDEPISPRVTSSSGKSSAGFSDDDERDETEVGGEDEGSVDADDEDNAENLAGAPEAFDDEHDDGEDEGL